MPELPEAEFYRRLADRTVGRTIESVAAPDDWFVKGEARGRQLAVDLPGCAVAGVDRHGKVVVLRLAGFGGTSTLALRFGMTGKLMVDDAAGVDDLLYSSNRDDPAWDRFSLRFTAESGGGTLRLNDPRRLGGVELDPDLTTLGPDARTITPAVLRDALAGRTIALKAALLDQSLLAGVGNLLADETLWRAGLDPGRAAGELGAAEIRRLVHHLRRVIDGCISDGGSHTGRLQPHREPGGRCPKCDAPLDRQRVGGRTTYSCPAHQH